MPLPDSVAQICNMALDQFGEAALVANIDTPTNEQEKRCSRHYAAARQDVLYKGVWNFAKWRVVLARSTETPAFKYADMYALPADSITPLNVFANPDFLEPQDALTDFDIQGNFICVNNGGSNALYLEYIRDVEDVTLWSPGFRQLVILTLALKLAYATTKKEELTAMIDGLLTKEIPDAVSKDGQAKPPARIETSRMLAARRGGVPLNSLSRVTPGSF